MALSIHCRCQRLATAMDPTISVPLFLCTLPTCRPTWAERFTPARQTADPNRLFPGNRNGTLTDRIAFTLTDQLYPLADAVLDMHSGDGNEDLYPNWVGYYEQAGDPAVIAGSKALAFAFGFEHIVPFQWALTDAANAIWAGSAAVAQGIPSIDVEAGGKNIIINDAVAALEEGIRRTLAHMNMTKERPPITEQKLITARTWISLPRMVPGWP